MMAGTNWVATRSGSSHLSTKASIKRSALFLTCRGSGALRVLPQPVKAECRQALAGEHVRMLVLQWPHGCLRVNGSQCCAKTSKCSDVSMPTMLTVRRALTAEVLAACGPPFLMVSEMALLYSLHTAAVRRQPPKLACRSGVFCA